MRVICLGAMIVACTGGAAFAQNAADPVKGQAYVTQYCSQCHSVEAGAAVSPNGQAPAFVAVANMPGMTGMALRVFLSDMMHNMMPNLVLAPADLSNVIAYILTLQKQPSL